MYRGVIYFACAMVLALTSCGVDDVEQKRKFDNDEINVNSPDCLKSLTTGCVQGQVIAAPDIYLAGTKYFDADELALKFKDHLDVKSDDGKSVAVKDYDLTFVTKMDNKSFVQDFTVYLKGSVARQDDVLRNGSFVLHTLPQGVYDLRVQKTFRIKLTPKAKATTDAAVAPNDKPATDVVLGKEYCVTLYSVLPIDIRKDTKTTGLVFDEFDFEAKSCGDSKPKDSITL